jgi:malonyl-CoA/methylmalonyl-CoA synthetase
VSEPLFPRLAEASERPALRVGDARFTYRELACAAGAVAGQLRTCRRLAVWADVSAETPIAVLGALLMGVPVVLLNPGSGARELEHVLGNARPDVIACGPTTELPAALAGVARLDVDAAAADAVEFAEPPPDAPALIVYTSGTTGPPKGAVLPRRAIAANLDALAESWEWTGADTVAHALPLFHVHGLVLATLGPIRRGGCSWHLGRFDPSAAASALSADATMLFAVPTMYHRLADAAEQSAEVAEGLGAARLLVSGSAALPAIEHERIARLTGQGIVERYGMTETLMIASARATGERRPGSVGWPLPGVDVRLVDDEGRELDGADADVMGEVQVRGQNLFLGYLDRPDATAEAFTADGYFRTGDLGVREPDGGLRLLGRRSVDLIKTGGFKVGAGEVEQALLEHPAVAEAAVAGVPDPDLGERIVAWVVLRPDAAPDATALTGHVSSLIAGHKRPREVRFVDALPRNAMGKVEKTKLRTT